MVKPAQSNKNDAALFKQTATPGKPHIIPSSIRYMAFSYDNTTICVLSVLQLDSRVKCLKSNNTKFYLPFSALGHVCLTMSRQVLTKHLFSQPAYAEK